MHDGTVYISLEMQGVVIRKRWLGIEEWSELATDRVVEDDVPGRKMMVCVEPGKGDTRTRLEGRWVSNWDFSIIRSRATGLLRPYRARFLLDG